MGSNAAVADRPSLRRAGWYETIAVTVAAAAVSVCAAAWITDTEQAALASVVLPGNLATLPVGSDSVSFEDRFLSASRSSTLRDSSAAPRPLDRRALAVVEMKIRAAKEQLAQRLLSHDPRSGFIEGANVERANVEGANVEVANVEGANVEDTRAVTPGIPIPRARPSTADVAAKPGPALAQDSAARPDERTLMQKLSDLLPGRVTLASLVSGGGLFRRGPDLAALGYDNMTAVYDITAHAVYLPNGVSLEAHSGMGNLRDDPEHVSVPMAGATPPATYDLKLRERLFHGVQALRMIPSEGSDTGGRSGLLAHSFMLGPKGDSNGCISIRDYDRFLKAFNDGEINRVVVVPSLSNTTLASAQPKA
jgi:Protein of unknown function (DUF2778)